MVSKPSRFYGIGPGRPLASCEGSAVYYVEWGFSMSAKAKVKKMKIRVIAYIDGLNLFYFLRKHHPDLMRVDLFRLVQMMLGTKYELIRVNYYTAEVMGEKQKRGQAAYLAALRKHPKIKIHLGEFKIVTKEGILIDSAGKPISSSTVRIKVREEKETDVTMASHIVWDVATGECDAVAVLTNDSDFTESLRLVREEAKKPVWLLSPTILESGRFGPHGKLVNVVTPAFVKRIKRRHLAKAQFPRPATDKRK